MKLALVQMSMEKSISENLNKSLQYCDMAKDCDLVFFPEIQLTPFFPQYHNISTDAYCMNPESDTLYGFYQKAKEHNYYISPNVYLEQEGAKYDASLWIGPDLKCFIHHSEISVSSSALTGIFRRAFDPVH